METETNQRLSTLKAEIRQLEASLSQSPDDAFGYLELGCLFAEADERDAAIAAFRQSYAHRTGGVAVPASDLPVVDEQLQEAFDVAVAHAPLRARGRTRELFEIAVHQEKRVETTSAGRLVAGAVLLVIMALAAYAAPAPTVSGYWPTTTLKVPVVSGYWPSPTTGW